MQAESGSHTKSTAMARLAVAPSFAKSTLQIARDQSANGTTLFRGKQACLAQQAYFMGSTAISLPVPCLGSGESSKKKPRYA